MVWMRLRGVKKEVFLSFTQFAAGVGVGVEVGTGVLVGIEMPPPPSVGEQPQEIWYWLEFGGLAQKRVWQV